MKTVKNSTITQGRMEQAIEHAVNRVAGPQISQQIDDAVSSERIRTGTITKFYHYLDKEEVDLDFSNEKEILKGLNLTISILILFIKEGIKEFYLFL